MSELLVQVGLSNLLLSAALGLVAYAVHRRGRYPALAHLLWVFVLLKAVTPPLLTVPIAVSTGPAVGGEAVAIAVGGAAVTGSAGMSLLDQLLAHGTVLLLATWVAGSGVVLTRSVLRVRRFGRLLRGTSAPAPASIQALAGVMADRVGLRTAPPVYLSEARVSPMSWWSRGRVRLILPVALVDQVAPDELRWVLAHELAHLKRRDHLVRWLEWLAVVAAWWNPVVWLARRQLRLDEEDACDQLVLERFDEQPRSYARTLLGVVEFLAAPTADAPPVATGIDAARSLEHRFSKIMSPAPRRQPARRVAAGVVAVAAGLMAFGFGPATQPAPDPDTGPTLASAAESTMTETAVAGPIEAPAAGLAYAPVSAELTSARSADGFSGTTGDDEYTGTARDETIVGGAGADVLSGRGGADTIRGGAGADTLKGGKGADTIVGGLGHDVIKAGAGNDVIKTWQDGTADRIDCGAGSKDRAVIDSTDTTRRCEVVVVRDS